MKVYITARYGRLNEMSFVASDLSSLGFEVTSRWVSGHHSLAGTEDLTTDIGVQRGWAIEDLEDLIQADIVISFTELPDSPYGRGGRHVEFGIAWAHNKRLVVVGPRENIFYTLEEVEVFDSWLSCLEVLRRRSLP